MRYSRERTVYAKYSGESGNPFLEALPEQFSKEEFFDLVRSELPSVYGLDKLDPQERRAKTMELVKWFQPMDYMYILYDMLHRAIMTTYQTKTVVDSVRQMNKIYEDFRTGRESATPYATQVFSGAVLGVPGIGKTSTIRRCLNLIPQVIVHTKYQEQVFYTKQITHLVVECPSDCSVKTLVFNIFSAIDAAIGSDYLAQATRAKSLAVSALTTKLKVICLNHHIGLVVIDEIQNVVSTASKTKRKRPLVKFLVELTNETATSICFCGTLEAEELFISEEHLKRRTRGLRLLPMKFDVTYRRFITELWQYQVTKETLPLTEKLMKQIYDLTAGIPAYIVKLFQEAQAHAILSGDEKITYDGFKQAMKVLGIEVPRYYGGPGISISDFRVREVCDEDSDAKEKLDGNDCPAVVPRKAGESKQVVPFRRFYATKRGRPEEERSKSDLISIWKEQKDTTVFLQKLESTGLVERKCE